MRSLLIIAVAFLIPFKTTAQQSVAVDVPMYFYGTRPAVEVMVNDKGPFLFLIDTGAQGLARADASLVKRLNLPTVGQSAASDTSARNEVVLIGVGLESLSIATLQFRKVTALSRNYNTSSYLPHLDGILGFDLFADYLLTLDYVNKRVRIERGVLPPPDGKRIISYEVKDGNPYIPITIGRQKLTAMVDSGNIRAIDLPSSLVRKLPLASYPKLIGKGGSVSGEFELREVRLEDTLSIAGYVFSNPVITFTEVYDEINIGSTLLREFALTFDQKNLRVRIRKGWRSVLPK